MKITKRQLRRLIREAINEARPHSFGSEGYEMTAQSGVDAKMFDAIQQVLAKSPGMAGGELVDAVSQMDPAFDPEDILDFLDELEGDGEILFNVEEDEWRLA